MKYLFRTFVIFFLLAPSSVKANPPAKKIQVGYHKTIETIMILRAISADDYFFSRIDTASKKRPLLYHARKYFAAYSHHPAVKCTQRMLDTTKDIGGILIQGALFARELPGAKVVHKPKGFFWEEHAALLQPYLDTLAIFYKEAGVEQFFEQYRHFYKGACAEVSRYMDDAAITYMEQYFGKQNASYTVYIIPLSPYGWGFSASVNGVGNTQQQFAIISPLKSLKDAADIMYLKEFGYDGPGAIGYYKEMVNHEFCHSFVTGTLSLSHYQSLINRYDSLYIPALDSLMQEQGYGNWWGFVNELFVRLGEIRVAAAMKDTYIDELRKEYVHQCSFVLLPGFEEYIQKYEQERGTYKTIDNFLPLLIHHFKDYNQHDIRDLLLKYPPAAVD